MAENHRIAYVWIVSGAINNRMKFGLTLLVIVAAGSGDSHAAPGPTNSASTNRILIIDPSSMAVPGGTVTLTIGTLQREDGVYHGYYKTKVFPYFYDNEKGKLSIVVSDESLTRINQGKVANVTGTATTSGKKGKSRPIVATATPVDINHGTLKVRFAMGDRQMLFQPAYHFSGTMTAAAPLSAETNFVSYRPEAWGKR
jgi:hypothetical protein